jgi:hypothetical protein
MNFESRNPATGELLGVYREHDKAQTDARANHRLPPPVLRELAGRLQELEDFTDQPNLELRAAHDATAEDRGYAEELLDRALASLEHLGEVAEAMMRRLDALLGA